MPALFDLLRFVWRHPLNRANRWGALMRVARWQLGSRLLPGPVAVPFVGEGRLTLERGMTGATGNWYCGLHELEEMAFVLHLLRPGDLFVDVGANIGSYSVMASAGVGARSVAIEPVPATFERMLRNARINALEDRMTCIQAGVSDAPGTLAFTAGLDTVNHVLAKGEAGDCVQVEVLALDSLPAAHEAALIKIDVEGHELAVLEGAATVLASPGLLAVVMEVNGSGARYGLADDALFACMAGHGFSRYAYDPFARRLNAPQAGAANAIFVRNVEAVAVRLRDAPAYRLVNGYI